MSFKVTSEIDFLVLASDGIWDRMTPQEVIDFINEEIQHKDLNKVCDNLINSCFEKLSNDNMTVIVIMI